MISTGQEQRLRLTFSKTGATRYIGHLDLALTLERAFNRASLPMVYSRGFTRRPKMHFAAALPLGFSSDCEVADIWLARPMDPESAREQLMARMAPGISVHRVEEVPSTEPPLQTLTREAIYEVTFIEPPDTAHLQARIESLLASESHVREYARGHRRKLYDLRPLIINVQLAATESAQPRLVLHLYLMETRNGRADEVLLALGLDPLSARIKRTRIILAQHAA